MWFSRKPSRQDLEERILTLGGQVNELGVQLFEAQQFSRIAEERLATWVQKHDELLIKYKQLISTHEPDTRA